MKNEAQWRPTKYVQRRGCLAASRDTREVAVESRLSANVIAECYSRHLADHARGRLLDLGCGSVPFYAAYRDHVTEITCVDWSKTSHGSAHIDIACDLTQPLPFGARSFDTVLLADVLEHIPTPKELWAEIERVLSPGGRVVMNVPFFYWLHEEPFDYYRYTSHALRRFVQESGMRVLVLEATGGVIETIADLAAKTIVRVPWVGRSLAIALQWIALAIVRTAPGQRASRRSGRRIPFGYFLVAQKEE